MTTVFLGMIAALSWGIHDICVRYVSRATGVFPAFMTVLLTGTLFCLPFAVIDREWVDLSGSTTTLAIASGLAFGIAGLAHFKAFSIGPVRLVAPIIGSYPVLSVGWAAVTGSAIHAGHWLAVIAVIGGVSVVAALSDKEEAQSRRIPAILWSVAAGLGWAVSFALGQAASVNGAEIPIIFISHLAAILIVLVMGLALGVEFRAQRRQIPLLAIMGALDTLALGVVLAAGALPRPEFASVVASTFGLITVLLAWVFLRERMSLTQWSGVLAVFAAVGYLGL